MSGLRERLERLRAAAQASEAAEAALAGETGGAAESVASEGGGGQGDRRGSGGNRSGVAAERVDGNDARVHPGFRSIGVEEISNDGGSFLLRRIAYPLPYMHGRYGLEELPDCAASLTPVAARQNQAREAAPVEASRMLFLDTETTGLGVGAGNVPFMVGFGYYAEGAFVVEQTLIRHPGEERAMLEYLLTHLKDKDHLVTYNGRTFDWPVLVNRYIMNGWRTNGAEPGHLDFLHPSRALWRKTLVSCRLAVVEEERLGFLRGEDVPGTMAPALYVQYLNDGNPAHLHGVYTHNEKDVLTLAALAVHFARLLEDRPDEDERDDESGEELYCTASWLEKHGQLAHAERLYDRLAERADAGTAAWCLPLAARYKKLGSNERAVALWEAIAASAEQAQLPRPDAFVELAMHYEHRTKDPLTALSYARRALELLGRRARMLRSTASRSDEREKLQRRVDRLQAKIGRMPNAGRSSE
ncbi:ribonuclease H-like domain-containing protein [Cohnella sp. GCM10027633]|uniref:ribonuclease H-like domain-containing protein n=1 Tax=unclassified Cohnella TaxID=2636738 RepID=UPI00363D3BC0